MIGVGVDPVPRVFIGRRRRRRSYWHGLHLHSPATATVHLAPSSHDSVRFVDISSVRFVLIRFDLK